MPAFRTENRRQINRTTPVANVTEACTPSCIHVRIYEPRSDKRVLLAIKVKCEILTEKERPSCCE